MTLAMHSHPDPFERPMARRAAAGLAMLLLLALGACSAGAPSGARGEGAIDEGDARVVAELLVDAASVRPAETVRVGVLFTLDPGWHIYWRHAGDAGAATELTWRTEGAEIGPTQWPAPGVFREADGLLTTFGYEGDVLLASDAVVASKARGSWRIEVDAVFATCKIQCIRGRLGLAREVPVTARSAPPGNAVRSRFDLAASRLPVPAKAMGVVVDARASRNAVRPGDEFRLAVDIASCVDAADDCTVWTLAAPRADEAFIPEGVPAVRLATLGLGQAPAAWRRSPGVFSLVVSGRASEYSRLDRQRLRGVVPLERAGRITHLQVDVPLSLSRTDAYEVVDPLALPPEGVDGAEGGETSGVRSLAPVGGSGTLVGALLGSSR